MNGNKINAKAGIFQEKLKYNIFGCKRTLLT
jgi:hypothetical protein